MFADLAGDGELAFHPEFVRHALGLALVKRMESLSSPQDASALLERFLDPIEGYDECAEILRAAATIALQRGTDPEPPWLGKVCTLWIQTQNLPEIHLQELAVLAPDLVGPLLDAIEGSDGHELSTARHIAINALAYVDKGDHRVADRIAERGARWQRFISLEKGGPHRDLGVHSPYALRRKRLDTGEYQNVWGQATMATPIRAGFTGSMTKNGGGLPLPEQIRTPHILILPNSRTFDPSHDGDPREPSHGPRRTKRLRNQDARLSYPRSPRATATSISTTASSSSSNEYPLR